MPGHVVVAGYPVALAAAYLLSSFLFFCGFLRCFFLCLFLSLAGTVSIISAPRLIYRVPPGAGKYKEITKHRHRDIPNYIKGGAFCPCF
jgi:hypothetical protein